MSFKVAFVVLMVITVIVLGGCQQSEPAQAGDVEQAATGNTPSSAPPPQGGVGELDPMNRLVLGTLKLEGREHAVTAEQAATLLPLWQLIQSDALQSAAETDAVVKQIEGQMTGEQLAAIEAMELTLEDMQAQGIELPAPGEGEGAPGGFQDMSEEERAQMREQFQTMSPEERATAMAEQGFQRPGGRGLPAEGQAPGTGQGPGGLRRGGNVMLAPLISLLTERAAE